MSKFNQPLPESLMKAIKATVASPDLTAREKFEAVILVTHGYGMFASASGTIDPTAYAIPEEQWSEVCDLLQKLGDGPVEQVNMSLDWMNIGPSSYDPEERQ